jgi:Spy/CpxP family protein refolding chaperone
MAEKRKDYKGKGMKGKHGMKGKKGIKSRGERMEKMDLTPAQQTRMKEINAAAKAKREAVKNNASLTDEAKKQQMTQIRKETLDARKKVLTAEQLKKMEEYRKNRPAKGQRTVKK